MMAETCGLSCWPSSLAPESKLSHNLEFHPGLVPRLSHHRGKNTALRAEKPLRKSLCGINKNVFLVFSFPLLEAGGCFHFGQQRRQVNLDSMKHEGKTNGYNPSTTEKGF